MSEKTLQLSRIEIESQNGLALRQLVPGVLEDADAYFGLVQNNRDHLKQAHRGGSDKTAEKYQTVEDVHKSILDPEDPFKLRFGIWDQDNMVGSINLTPKENHEAEIGYWVGKKHIGKGYAAQAIKLLSGYAFEKQGADLVFAHVFVGNEASKRSLEKAGFGFVETFQRNGEQLWVYQLTKP